MNANVGENNIVAENTIVEQELKEKTDVRKDVYGVFKRIIDILGGFVGAILLIPVTIGVYIARKILKEYLANNDEARKEFEENQKLKNDPRITKIGDFLRKTSIDELPQLINVLKGEMSLIGPRPIVDGEIEKYGTNKDKFLSVKPGLTGYWAANGRNNITYSERIKMELYYVDNMSFGLDLKIFLKTIVSVIKKEGAN